MLVQKTKYCISQVKYHKKRLIRKYFPTYYVNTLHANIPKDLENNPAIEKKIEGLIRIQQEKKCDHFVETGTYLGVTTRALASHVSHVYSIELSKPLYKGAKKRLKHSNIQLFHGNSTDVLPQLMRQLKSPALFYLDGHYSCGITAKGPEETPILKELQAIFDAPPMAHVIVIDDIVLFTGESTNADTYPSISELETFIKSHRAQARIQYTDMWAIVEL